MLRTLELSIWSEVIEESPKIDSYFGGVFCMHSVFSGIIFVYIYYQTVECQKNLFKPDALDLFFYVFRRYLLVNIENNFRLSIAQKYFYIYIKPVTGVCAPIQIE